MSNPFQIDGPAVISFSGGRTSAYMLRRILDEGLRPDVHIVFANTGKERPETLDFIQECATRWAIAVRWVEWQPDDPKFKEVTYETAARAGEPFTALILKKQFLPNPVMRFCTQHLKIEAMKRFHEQVLGMGEAFVSVIGIRHDEPRRWRILGQDERNRHEMKVAPLVEAGIGLPEVMAFWAAQLFDLRLRPDEGNCDLCFLKGLKKKVQIVRDRPDLATWWIQQEQGLEGVRGGAGRWFRKDQPSYASMVSQGDLFTELDDDLIECACTD